MNSIFRVLFYLSWVTGLCAAVLLMLPVAGLESIVQMLANPRPDQLEKISQLFLSEERILYYRIFSGLLVLLLSAGLVFRSRILKYISFAVSDLLAYLSALISVMKNTCQELRWYYIVLIGALPLLALWQAHSLFLFTVDEAFSWVHLVRKGPIVAALYYPAPNNHIFYSVICSLLNYTGLDPVWVMRIPVMFSFVLTAYALYFIVNKLIGQLSALLSVLFFVSHPSMIYYGLHGRGYMFMIFFCLLSAWFYYHWLHSQRTAVALLFLLCAALGIYTIPVFVYYLIMLFVFGLFYLVQYQKTSQYLSMFKLWLLLGVLILFLYLPVVVLNGKAAILDNGWVQPQNYTAQEVWVYFIELVTDTASVGVLSPVVATVFLLLFAFAYFFEHRSATWLLWGVLAIVPVIAAVLCLQHVLPYARVWVAMTILWVMIVVWLHSWLVKAGGRYPALCMMALLLFLQLKVRYHAFEKGDPYYEQLHAFVQLIEPTQVQHVYSDEDAYLVLLQVEFIKAGKEIPFTAVDDIHGRNADLRVVSLKKVEAISEDNDKQRFYANDYICAYQRKGIKVLKTLP